MKVYVDMPDTPEFCNDLITDSICQFSMILIEYVRCKYAIFECGNDSDTDGFLGNLQHFGVSYRKRKGGA